MNIQNSYDPTLGMTFEEYFGYSQYEEDPHETPEEPVGVVFDADEYDLFKVSFSDAVLSTHMAMADALEARLNNDNDVLRFYSDYTGRGKTSGAILHLGEMIESGQIDRVLFLTREIAGVEEVYRTFKKTWPHINVVPWSTAHRKGRTAPNSDLQVSRSNVTRDEAKVAQVVISTHAAGKQWRTRGEYPLGQNFDIVLIDEYPDPVASGQFHLSEAQGLYEKYQWGKMGKQAKAIRDWMSDLQEAKGRLPRPDWAKDIDPRFPKEVLDLAEAVRQGRSFIVTRGEHRSLHWSRLNMPFEGKALLCSATNELEGWRMDPRLTSQSLKEHRGFPTDYSQVKVTFAPWPREPAKVNNAQLKDPYTVEQLQKAIFREVAHGLPKDDGETLVLMPKTLRDSLSSDFLWQLQKSRGQDKVYIHHWGSGIGTNAYQDCRYAVVVGLFHQNAFGIHQKIKGHKLHQSEMIETYGANSKEVTTTKNNEHARHIIQMLNRIRIRGMDTTHSHPYVAKSAHIRWIATPKDTERACGVLETAFHKIEVDRSAVEDEIEVVDDPSQVRGWEQKAKVICNQMEKAGRKSFTSKDVGAEFACGYPKQPRQRQRFRAGAEDLGWTVVPGDGRGKPTTFTKDIEPSD